jgi:aspartokinase/homoserine dehydrogenase 1
VVVPGFFGAAGDGAVATFGRGGSDLTATLLARVLGAAEVTLWKDVPGFLTADPRLVPGARVVPQLDPREASELAYHGASVLHPRALTPLDCRTTLRIRPFADPNAPGTTILRGRAIPGKPVRALSAMTRQALVTLESNGMVVVPGLAARALGVLAGIGIAPSSFSQAWSEHAICFTVPEADAEHVRERLQREFANEIVRGDVEQVEVVPGLATVAVVGAGMSRTPGVAARVFGAVADAHVSAVTIAQGSSERCLSLVIHAEHVPEVVRAIHAAFRLDKVGGGRMDRRRGADVILLGCGRIGRELLEQISAPGTLGHPALRVIAVLDRDGFVFDHRGLQSRRLAMVAACKQRGGSLNALPGGRSGTPLEAIELIASHALRRPVIVDVAIGDTGPALLAAVRHGMQVVLANKVPLASSRDEARLLLAEARSRGCHVRYEATVGAGLPVIDTIEKLFASGDQVLKVAGCPSGTMGYLMTELGRGRRFSEALRQAMHLGYTEPDPREDLSGCDVARKALILGRRLGYDGEICDVQVESLVPGDLRDVPLAHFLEQLETLDQAWLERIEAARLKGEVLRYRAHASRAGVKVGLVGVPVGSSLAALDGTDNQFVFTTARYWENPLVISGPGAGPAVTAAGVLNDILRVAGDLDIPLLPRAHTGDRQYDPAPAGTYARTGGVPLRSTSSARA